MKWPSRVGEHPKGSGGDCIRYAFEVCRKRNKKKRLTLCGKTNVLMFEFRSVVESL